jgi:hypothetical protein
MTTHTLPPLPEPVGAVMPEDGSEYLDCYTAAQMHEYALAALAQPVPDAEPVAWRVNLDGLWCHARDRDGLLSALSVKLGRQVFKEQAEPLYAAAHPQPAPLTEEQIDTAIKAAIGCGALSWVGFGPDECGRMREPIVSASHYQLARAIERAHGIVPAPTTGEGRR